MDLPLDVFMLDNGLRVTLAPDDSVPVVAVNLWYGVGSAHERPGRTGFAHLFEHMLFQGSASVAANEHFELIQGAGGTANGSTWLDRTNYYETVPSHYLDLALWLEADRMGHLLPAMTQAKLDTQRDVVKNERRWSVDNQPYGTWWEKLPALAYPEGHPYHHSLIGSLEDLDAATLEDVTEFFALHYTPDNAVLSIAGDLDLPRARSLVMRHFAAIPPGTGRPPLTGTAVPLCFDFWNRETVADDVSASRLFMAWRIAPFGMDESVVADVCATLLASRRGSFLHQRLVREERIAMEVNAFTLDLAHGADLLVVDVTGHPGVGGEHLEEALVRAIDELPSQGLTQAALDRAIAVAETSFLLDIETAEGRADMLSKFATYLGDPGLVRGHATDSARCCWLLWGSL
ncbi:MAG: M16 family metallopeptidase [Gemmatimonadaceae bacterium]